MGNKSLNENIILEANNTQESEKTMFLKYSSSKSRARKIALQSFAVEMARFVI